MRGTLRILLIFLAIAAPARALPPDEPYQEIRIRVSEGRSLEDLRGIPDLEVMGLGDRDVRLVSKPSRTRELIARGWTVEILHEDLQAYYASRQQARGVPGVWHTYDETVAELESLRSQHPDVISAPFSIGRTLGGRDIWAVRISDHPDSLEEEPEVLFDAVHHAREIMTVELLLAFANYVCAQYPADPVVRDLVEGRQIYLVPIVNPDGFAYNEEISPGGGGMWRKNRRPNPGSCVGVDNNRNYPFQWGRDDGSSGQPCTEDFRGSAPGSEAENQAMMAFVDAHRFVTHVSFHSVAGMVLFPWCYTPQPSPDDSTLRKIAGDLARANAYRTGQCPELLYLTSGDFIDWTYGETQQHPPVISFTTEIGGTGFWPNPSEKDGLIQENLPSMFFLAQIAGPSLRMGEIVVRDDDDDQRIEAGEMCRIAPAVVNDGLLATAQGVSLRLGCDDPYVVLLHASAEIGGIGAGGSASPAPDSLVFRVEDPCPRGRRAPFTLTLGGASNLRVETPFELGIGDDTPTYEEDFESPAGAWGPDPSTTATAGLFVRAVPESTAFQPGEDATPGPGADAWFTGVNAGDGEGDVDEGVAASRSPLIDLSQAGGAYLTLRYFHGQRDGGDDPEGDFFRVDASSDGGDSWVNLVMIGDAATAPIWRSLTIELGKVIDLTDRVCLRVQVSDGPSDGDLIEGGIDDVRIVARDSSNEAPGAPAPTAPADGEVGLSRRPILTVDNAADPEGDPLTYGFRIYAGHDPTRLVASADGVSAGGGATSWRVSRDLAPGVYSWRAFAADSDQRGYYGAARTFTVSDSSGMPPTDALLSAGPNPMKGSIRIRYAAPPAAISTLAIYDPRGRLVRRLETIPSASGWEEIVWDGRDASDRRAPSGPYWVRLRTAGETRTVQVVRVD
jgi:hypothetical protein